MLCFKFVSLFIVYQHKKKSRRNVKGAGMAGQGSLLAHFRFIVEHLAQGTLEVVEQLVLVGLGVTFIGDNCWHEAGVPEDTVLFGFGGNLQQKTFATVVAVRYFWPVESVLFDAPLSGRFGV